MENQQESVPEVAARMTLQEYANTMAKELFKVKESLPGLEVNEIGAMIEQIKINLAMSRKLFDMLTLEHTNRLNIDSCIDQKPKLPFLDSIKTIN